MAYAKPKFKIGDTVKRIICTNCGWKVGDIGVIYKIEDWQGDIGYYLKSKKGKDNTAWHRESLLEKVNIVNYNLFKEIV